MKTASVKEIKQEIENISPSALVELTMKLVKFKKEIKELSTYLLFEAHDEASYVAGIKESLHLMFTDVNVKSLYITKKNLRKILRVANRYIKYSSDPLTEIEVLIYICREIRDLDVEMTRSTALLNLYNGIIKKLEKNIHSLHEDLQYDYLREVSVLKLNGN